ncbi:MAG: MMPL family transporter, partial [Bacteroidales bacterium]|nr:MMPL family transporter [Bacteroidales bacterium]
MWQFIASIILRKKGYVISIVVGLIFIMLFFARKVEMSYELAQMLPQTDSTYKEYIDFKKKFGEDGTVMVVGITDPHFFQLDHFQHWYELNLKIKNLSGVEEVVSPTRVINLVKNDSTKKYSFEKVVSKYPEKQAEVDSIKEQLASLKFYNGLIYNEEKNLYMMAITLDKKRLNDKSRVFLVDSIDQYIQQYTTKFNVETHISGLPYIRTAQTEKIKKELYLFVILSLIVSFFVLLGLFRSFRSVMASLVVVGISVIFTLGLMGIFHFKITILTGI